MNNERDHKPDQPITLKAVTQRAKETLLADGKHMPMVIAEGEQQGIIVGFDDMPETHLERVRRLFLAGIAAAKEGDAGPLKQVFFIGEGWMSIGEGKLPEVPPSEDPDRMEVLIVAKLRLEDMQTKLAVVELIRDQNGVLRELKDFQPPGISEEEEYVENSLVAAFVVGYELGNSETVDGLNDMIR